MSRLDWTDRAAVEQWLTNLRDAIDDADDAASDQMLPPRKRDYGPRMARKMYRDASASIERLLDYASPEPADDESGEPEDGCPS